MKSHILQLAAHVLVLSTMSASAAIRYVNVNSADPLSPYTNWTTAAMTIQAAVDAAVAGDQILVTNGIYQTGGGVVFGAMTNRVAVDKLVTVQSVNGAAVTVIRGFQVPDTTNGDSAIRCVYMTNGAALVGFTLTHGATREGGSGDYEREQFGGGVWCETTNALVSHCVLTGNSASGFGGGASGGTLNNCTLDGNSASIGGGAYNSTLNNCTLSGNSASEGGGAYYSTLNHCTLTANSAHDGGGASGGTLNNCIVYYNSARSGANYSSDISFSHSCTTPLPPGGVGNISSEPLLADLSHLTADSPCRGAGSPAYSTGLDIDGESWANPPSIGCDEYHPSAVTGPLSVSIEADYTNVAAGFVVNITAAIAGRATSSRWDFGDGTVVHNRPYASHSWPVGGDYSVVFLAYNDTYPDGISATVTVHVVAQPVHYVALGSAHPVAPYMSWETAANNIQDAVDAASLAGALVLVTNGVYLVTNGAFQAVAVNKPLALRSVNGAAATVIDAKGAGRCVYLAHGAALVGFTLANGALGQFAHGAGVSCESPSAVVSNCVLTGNSVGVDGSGGGAYGGTLNNCTLTGNSATHWGHGGGGAASSTLNNCTLTGNSTSDGGGGGAYRCTLNNCTLTANSAYYGGGAVAWSTLNNCTLTGNSAHGDGGGAYNSTLNNCIVYYNSARSGDNYSDSVLNYSCTTPLPPGGVGNISAEPQLSSASHVGAGSPCRGAGSAAYSTGLDMDGESWANPPSIGCDEYHPGAVTGPLSLSIQTAYTNVAVGFTVNFTAAIDGRATANRWEFGDGTVVSNRPYASHSWAVAGDYSAVFKAHNDTYPGGISAPVTVHVVAQPVHYVALDSPNPVAPYTSWATAAHNIQDVVDAASVAGALVLVTNGVYQTGGRVVFGAMTNRVAVDKPVTVQSVNGAAVTMIRGSQVPGATNGDSAIRCVLLTNGAALVGFTLTDGATRNSGSGEYQREQSGGGVWCESASAVVSNCTLSGNSAGQFGGGAYGGTLNNCTLSGNSADFGYGGGGASGCTLNNCTLTGNSASYGGGASDCTLNNCTLTGNSAINSGGGASDCTLNNCIVYYNSAPNEANYLYSVLGYSCTTPLPTNGIGNLTKAPLFVDYSGGNLRLQSNSPCVNAGANASAPAGPDLDGNPRIAGRTVDLGAYEFQSPQSFISNAWLQQYNLPTDGSADNTDVDDDRLNNWQEWRAGTNPTNALSVLHLLSPVAGAPGVVVSWQSVSGLSYLLERGTDLGMRPPFLPLATNIVGQPGTTTFRDTNAAGAGPFFYHVGVQE